ncbi:hypothetical protein M885DRAFT_624615 [Pelagophyceae sp. CCMP2097]|nr:hypothetical protein M885DRAFT_624615 [Pelagophyceae sp. CCMP2097]
MMSELDVEGGCVPSPESLRRWEHVAPAPPVVAAIQRTASAPPFPTDAEELARARARIAQLEADVAAARTVSKAWGTAASMLANALILSPHMLHSLSAEVSRQLEKALGAVSFVEAVHYVDCSFPATAANAPKVELVHWNSIEDSEWLFNWSPSWSCKVCVDGRQFVFFTTVLRVSEAQIGGALKLAFSPDLSSVSIRFVDEPEIDLNVACNVALGTVPLPLQAQLSELIKSSARKWITNNLVAPNDFRIHLADRKKDLSDDDVAKATKAAMTGAARAASWNPR